MKTIPETRQATVTLRVEGDLTSTTAENIRTQANALIDAPPGASDWRALRLDLARTKMVDSVGLNLIVSILKAVQRRGAVLEVVYSNPNVHRTFLFTRLDKHVTLVRQEL